VFFEQQRSVDFSAESRSTKGKIEAKKRGLFSIYGRRRNTGKRNLRHDKDEDADSVVKPGRALYFNVLRDQALRKLVEPWRSGELAQQLS
jgi:hypothetical protein